jgi:hypothetical protein
MIKERCGFLGSRTASGQPGRVVITAIYPVDHRKVYVIMKMTLVCPVFRGDFSPGE